MLLRRGKAVRQLLGGVFAALLLAGFAPAALSYPVGFAGGGTPGTDGLDAFGHTWRIKVDSWGIPGLGNGTLGFAGPDSALDFHIRFSGLPTSVVIDPSPASGPGGFEETTRFSNVTDGELWSRVIDADGLGVSFFATGTSSLENGETFFVNVVFSGAFTTPIEFTASWTGRGVPEPGTLALLLVGAAMVLTRRQRAA